MTLRPKAYSEDCGHYTINQCCAWGSYVIAPKSKIQEDSMKNRSKLEERSPHHMCISNVDSPRIGEEQANRLTNINNGVKCHVSGLKHIFVRKNTGCISTSKIYRGRLAI